MITYPAERQLKEELWYYKAPLFQSDWDDVWQVIIIIIIKHDCMHEHVQSDARQQCAVTMC